MRLSSGALAIVLVVLGASAGCNGLILKKEDRASVKGTKLAGRFASSMATGGLSEVYYAAKRSNGSVKEFLMPGGIFREASRN
jgi:hypothetical protein